MTRTINLLLTSAGRRVPVIRAFKQALSGLPDAAGKVVCTEMEPLSAGLYISDSYFIIPGADKPGYIPALLEICRQEQIAAIIPTTDEELLILSKEKGSFLNQGTQIIVSSFETVAACSDKMETYNFLSRHGISTPRTFLPEDLPPIKELKFPLFVKPRNGKGSINSYPVNNIYELEYHLKTIPQPVIQQLVRGREYTADVLCDLSGRVLTVVPRERIATVGGVSQKGRTVKNPVIIKLAAEICQKLNIIGPANVQFIVEGSESYCLEINPRLSGGLPLTLAAGADFPGMILDMVRGKKLSPAIGRFKAGLFMLRYDESIFVEEGQVPNVPFHSV